MLERDDGPDQRDRLDQVDALAVAALVVVTGSLYVATACPTVFWYDSAEYAAAAYTLGVPHPPGYPVYVWIGYAFTHLTDDPARGLNLMSSVFAALTVALTYGVARALTLCRSASVVAAIAVAQNPVFWRNAVIAEVYTPALAALAGVWWLAVLGHRHNRPTTLVAASGVAGIGLGLHLFLATTGLGFTTLVFTAVRHQAWRSWRSQLVLATACLIALGVGALVFAWVPWRAATGPAINFEAPPTDDAWWWMLSGGQYKHWFVAGASWDRVAGIVAILADFVSWPGLVVAGLGLAALTQRSPSLGIACTLGVAGNLWFFYDYRVHDVEVFFLPSGWLLALAIGVALDRAREWTVKLAKPGVTRALLAVAVAGLVTVRLAAAFWRNDLALYDDAARFAERARNELPRDAIVVNYTTFPEWKFDAVLRSYARVVLGHRPDLKYWLVPATADVAIALDRGADVFAYHPVPILTREFDVQAEGVLYRVRRRATPSEPR